MYPCKQKIYQNGTEVSVSITFLVCFFVYFCLFYFIFLLLPVSDWLTWMQKLQQYSAPWWKWLRCAFNQTLNVIASTRLPSPGVITLGRDGPVKIKSFNEVQTDWRPVGCVCWLKATARGAEVLFRNWIPPHKPLRCCSSLDPNRNVTTHISSSRTKQPPTHPRY